VPKHIRAHYLFILIIVGLAVWGFASWRHGLSSSSNTQASKSQAGSISAGFDKKQFSTDKADSLWVVVNKTRALPSTYVPSNLVNPNVPLRLSASDPEMHMRTDAGAALEKLFAGADTAGIHYHLSSGYRSYAEQQQLYQMYVSQLGLAAADESSARPGHSEHQTGLAADVAPASGVCDIQQCFASTPEGQWLAANAYRYGFIIRYQSGSQAIVGYEYEPWHIRYVGSELAAQLQKNGQTLEQFLGLPPAPNYSPVSKQLNP